MDIQTYELPDNWACYLINGDESGYDEGEVDLIDQWLLRTFPENVIAWAVDVVRQWRFHALPRRTQRAAIRCKLRHLHVPLAPYTLDRNAFGRLTVCTATDEINHTKGLTKWLD